MSTYDDIAGFDTSSLGLGAAALQAGQAGIDVANAAFFNLSGAVRYANAVALIEAAAGNGGVSPVRALLAFVDRLNQLDGDSSHFTAIGAEIAGLVASGSVDAAAAMADFLPAINAYQIGRSEVASIFIAVANAGALDVQLVAGCYYGQIITRGSFEGGEGGGTEGGEGGGGGWPGGTLSMSAAVQAIHNAVVGGSLGETQAYAMLAGLMVSPFPAAGFQAMNELRALIGSDTDARDDVIDIFIASVGILPFNVSSSAAGNIMSLLTPFSTPDLSLPELASHVHAAVAAGNVTAEQAIVMMVRFAPSYNSDAIAAANDVATEVLSLVDDGFISQGAALDALTGGDAFTAARFLVAVASVDPDAAPAAGLQLATLIDTTTPTFMVPNNMMTAQQALTFVNAGVSLGGLSGASAVVLLTAMAFVPGGLTSDRNAMNVAADGVRGLLAGTMGGSDAAAAVVSALAPLGFTPAQGITFLLALGASGTQQVFGSSIIWVFNADLSAAASAAIAGLIHDNDLSAAAVGAALDGVFPLGADDVQLAVSTLLRAAPALAALAPGGYAAIGAALAHAANVSQGLAMGQLNDRMLANELSDEALIAILAGYAGGGDAGDQVAAGRQLNAVVDWTSLLAADAMVELDAAVAAGALTRGQAIVLLAGTATSSLPDGLADLLAKIAAYMNADPAAGAAALDGAVSVNALSIAQGLYVLTAVATLGSAATGAAITGVLLSWVHDGVITADDLATQLLGVAQQGGDHALRAVAGDNIAALIGDGALTTQDAIALIDAAVPGSLDAHTAIAVLAHMAAAGDAALQEAVQLQIASMIGGGDITLQAAIADLQAMLPGASAALQAVLDAELAILLTDPATLAQTAGLGSAAQVQAAANAIVLLFSTDPTAAQGILDALADRIQNGDLTPQQAANLLARIYDQGGAATAPVLATIDDLTPGHIPLSTMADAIVAQATGGGLSATEIFAVLGPLSAVNAAAVNSAVAGLVSSGVITVSALDAAVDGGQYTDANAVAVLQSVVPGAAPALRAEALAEIQALASANTALAAQALPTFIQLAISGDHDLRLVGREGIEALAAAAPGVGDTAFLQLLSYLPVPDTAFLTDLRATLAALLEGAYLTTAQAIQHIDDQLSPGNPSPLINAFQAVDILVTLAAVNSARTAIYDYIRQEVAANSAAQAAGPSHPMWPFTAQPVITALAKGTGADLDHVEQTALVIVNISATLTTNQVVTSLGQGSTALIVLVAGFINRGMAEFGSYLAARVASLPPSEQIGSLDVISTLIGNTVDDLQLSDASELLLAIHASGAKAAALAELADIGTSASFFIMAAVTSGATTLANGVEVMVALATGGASGFEAAMATYIGDLLTGGQFTPAAVMSALEAAVADGALATQEMVALLQDVFVARLDPTDLPATAALQTTILAEIDALIAAHQITFAEAVTAIASSASGQSSAMLLAIGGEIAAFVGSHPGSESASVAGILAAATGVITGAEALGLLVGEAIWGGADLQVAAGGGIAGLVAAGSITPTAAAIGVYNAYLNSGLSLDNLVAVTEGMWASGGTAVGAELLYQVASHGFETYEAIADRFAAAVDAGTLSVGNVIDGSVALVLRSSSTEAGADFLSALISEGLLGAGDAVVALGTFISPSSLSATQAISVIAHLVVDLPSAASSFGAGLAALAVAGQLSLSDAAAGLADLLDAGFAGLDFADVAAVLVGAATVAAVAGQAHAELDALIGNDAQRTSDAIDIISDAALHGVLTPAGVVALLVAIAEGGTPEQQVAVGRALDSLVLRSIVDAGTVFATLTAEVDAGHMDGAAALFVLLQQVHDATGAQQAVSNINYLLGHEAVSAHDAVAAVLAAAHTSGTAFASGNAGNVLISLAYSHTQPPIDGVDRAVIVEAGAALADLVADGEIVGPTLLLQIAASSPSAAIPLLVAIGVAAGASALGQDARTVLSNTLDSSGQPYASAQSIAHLVGPGGLTAAQGLAVLADIAVDGGVVMQVAVGQEFARLLAEHAVTTADLHAALYVGSVSDQAAAMMLAAMIDADAATIPVALQELIVSAVRLPAGATSWEPYVQPLIAALANAVISDEPVPEASGLRLGQAVLAISSYARVGDPDVIHDAGVAIAALATFYHATDSVFALLSRALVSDPPYGNLNGRQIAEVGVALGFTPSQTADAVANGIDHGLAAADVINVLARLTSFDSASLGLVSGAAIAGLTHGQITSTQAMDALLGLTGVSGDNMMLLLAGFAGAGTAADQIAAGRAIAYLPTFDAQLLTQIPAGAVGMVALGIAASGAPYADILLIALSLQSGQDLTPALMAALAAAADAGTLPAADGVRALVYLAVNVTFVFGDEALAMRTALHEELVDLVRDHLSGDVAAGIILTSVPASSSSVDKMRAEAGGMLAALVDAGLASAADIAAALSASLAAGTNTPAAIAAFIAGAALNHEYTNPFPTSHDLAKSLGHTLGELIEAGIVGIADAMAGMAASQSWFHAADYVGEITMLAAVATHDAAGLQVAVGHALAGIYQSGQINGATFIPAFDAMVGVPGGLTAEQATAVLFGMAESVSFGVLYDIGAEFANLVHRGLTTAQQVADGMTAEMSAGHISAGNGLALLAYFVVADNAFAGAVGGEIAELIRAGGLTQPQTIDGLLGAANAISADLAVARIIGALVDEDTATYAYAATAIVAAQGGGSLTMGHATAIMISLAETADESGMGFLGVGFGHLIERGLDPVAVQTALSQALQGHLVTAAQAASLVAYVAGAISNLPNADGYHYGMAASILAQTAPEDAVAAFDRAYELGGIDAHDVVSLLTWMHGVAGTFSRWEIGRELWKMFDEGGVAIADIFAQVVAHNSASWMQGSLIGAMAATDDASRQITVGHALGEFIADGHMSPSDALMGLELTGLSGAQYTMLILSVAGTGGPAVEMDVGAIFGRGLASTPVNASDVDHATIDALDDAVAAGALAVPALVGLLVGMGMAQYPSPYAVRTSIYALDALVTSGRITADAAMTVFDNAATAVVDGAVPWLEMSSLVYWLAVASTTPSLHDAVAAEIVELISDGALSAAQAFDYIREMIETPLDVADLLAISGNTVANLYVSIAGHGDVGLQDAAGAHLGALPGGPYLSPIDTAVTGGSLSAEGALHVIANLLGALASDSSATARNWAVSHLGDYVSGGLVAVATVSSVLVTAAEHATMTGLTWIGAVMGGLDLDVAAIHNAIASGDLTAGQGTRLLLGMGADGEGIDATFVAARAEIVALVTAGHVSAAQVLAEAATSSLDQEHLDALAFGLVGHGTAADDAAIAAYFGAEATVFGDQVGRQDDSFFTGVVDEVGLVFAKVQGGQITVAQAIDAIEAYADEHGVSSYAGVYSLNSLFSRYGNGAGVAATNVAMIDKIVIGDLSAELAVGVAEGTTSAWVRDPAGGTHVEAADTTAITQQQAIDLLNWEATRAFLPENVDLVRFMFADDLWVARQVRIDSNPFTPFSMNAVIDAARIGNAYYNTGIQDVGRSAYAYDLALVALMEQVTAADRPADQQDYTIALNALSTRLINGGAEGALVAQYAAGNLSFDQVLLALDKEVAATALGPNGADREMMHDISLAWLNLSARKYIVQNPGTAGAIEAGQLLIQLGDAQYSDDLLTGFGALLGLSSSGATAVISSLDRQEAYQAAFDTIRARTPTTLPLNERDQAVLDVLIPMANGMQFVLERQPLGRALLTVGDDPTDAANYARLGAQVGVIFANKLAVDAMFAGTPWGAAITAAKFGAQVGLFVLSMGAVQDAIGEGPTLYLRGQLTIAGATASLLGDSLSDLAAAGAEIAISSAPHFVSFSNAVASGDAEGIASSIGELAADYYMLQTGVDPRLYGAVGERFADLIVHLFTGDTGALGDDVRALGSAYLDTILKNPYLAAIGSRMVQYAETINGALQDINDSYRILGENVVTGLLLVGTRLDGAGNAIRDVAHKVGGFFADILHGIGIDGYISGATVFADANFNGALDPGEVSTTTDANGNYSITSNGAPLILQGGVDTATNLAFTGTMQAPAGSTVVTPLTTLIQKVAASTTGDPVAAQQLVASALGLSSSLDLNDLDTVAATRTGVSGATHAFAAASSVLNTVSLLHAAGATDAFDVLVARIVATNTLDLTDNATLLAIAASAGLAGGVASAVAQLAGASNALTEQAAASATDPMRFLRYVTAVSMAAQGDTAHDLAAAGSDATQLANVLADHTGTGLSTQVSGNRTQVGGFGDTGTGGGEVPLKISADGHGIELAPNGGVAVAGNWVRLAAQDFGSHAGSTVLVYTVDSSGNVIDHTDDHSGSALTGLPSLGSVGGVEDDHGKGLLLGAQSVYLAAGEQLRFAVLSGNQIVDATPSTQFASRGDGSLQVIVDGLHLTAVTNNSLSTATTLADAQRDTGDAFVFLKHGQTLSVELAGSSANVNTLGFVRIDIDAATGARSVAGVAFGDTAAFAAAVRSHMDGGLHEVHGGDFAGTVSWTVSGDTGYYAPVLITPSGQTFVIGTANPGGHEQIRMFGENTFGFEDLAYNQGSDFDYNDMVMRLKPASDHII